MQNLKINFHGESWTLKKFECSAGEYEKCLQVAAKMKLTNNAKFMHCLPVRRNVIVADDVIDSANSVVIEQANNRTFAAQLVLQKILKDGK